MPFWSYAALMLLVALAAVNTANNLLYWLFGMMAAGILVSGFVSGLMMLRLRVRRISPEHTAADQLLLVRYAIEHRGRLVPAFSLRVREMQANGDRRCWSRFMKAAEAWVMHVGPGETVHGEAFFRPTRRGVAAFNRLEVSSSFPFGLIGKSIYLEQPQRAVVYPRLYSLQKRVLETLTPPGVMGSRISRHAGAGDDYFGLRAYRPGDSLRHVAWKRTANRDELLTITRTRPSPPRLRIVLCLNEPTDAIARRMKSEHGEDAKGAARKLEERALSLAASLASDADDRGFEVGLTVLGVEQPAVEVSRSLRHRRKVLSALAGIDLDQPRTAARYEPSWQRPDAAVVVVHPDRVDPEVAAGEAWHLTGHQLATLATGDVEEDGGRSMSGGEAAVAEARRGRRRGLIPKMFPGVFSGARGGASAERGGRR